MKIKQFIILLFFTVLSLKNFASHIVGGEIYYDCLGGNNYRITLKVYRDCFNGIPPFDNPAYIFIFNSAGVFIDSVAVPAPASVVLPFPLSNPCLTPPTNICVEEAIYQVTINLPPLAGGYNMSYQRCCRNNTILNLVNPGSVGSTYMAHIPDPGLAVCNSSPHYNNFPPIFLCAGVPLNFDHSATDPDGDSLYYELCNAFTGLNQCCCTLGPWSGGYCSGGCAGICPEVGSPPPFSFVPYLSPYNGTYPLSSSPALAVNPITGLMTGTPNMIGQWVVAVCVSEYRNGILLDVNKRDFQFNVVNCGIPVASIPVQQPFCFGSPSNFTQNSMNAFTYLWDFGDPGTTLDVSNAFSPSWTYASIGSYTLTLIVNPNTVCTDTATLTVTVNSVPAMTSSNTATICSGGTVSIPLSSNMASTFSWVASNNSNTTGESTSAQSGNTLSNTITNNSATAQTVTYTVTPTSSPQGCVGTPQTVTVTVNPPPAMTSPNSATICNGGTVSIPLTSNWPSTYTWIAANNANTSGESTTTQTGSPLSNTIGNSSTTIQSVVYTVTPTSTPQGCLGTPQTVTVSVMPTPTMTSPTGATVCSGVATNIPLTSNVASTYSWVAADNTNTIGESTTTQTGTPLINTITNSTASVETVAYTITPTSVSGSCPGTPQAVNVSVNPGPTMTNPSSTTICNGETVSIPLTSNMTSTYTWSAADNANTSGESTNIQSGSPLSNTIFNNTIVVQAVIYTVTPTSSPQGCVGTPQTVTVTLTPSPTMTNANTATICDGTAVNIPLTSTMPSTYTWIAADNTNTTGESTTLQNGSPLNNVIINISTSIQSVIYTVTPTLLSGTCAGIPQTLTVTVIPPPTITSPSSASICSGETVTVPLTSNVPSTYTWIAIDNTNTTGESITTQTGTPLSNTITNSTSVTQTVTYSVTPTSSPDGCLGVPQTLTATVYNGITADFDFFAIPCTYQVSFYDSSAVGPVSWLWYFDDGDSSILQNPAHTFDTTGTYDVQLVTSTSNNCFDTVIVQVDFAPVIPIAVSSADTICRGNNTPLNASGGFSYLWSPPASLSNPGISNPIANPDTTTTYTVSISTVDLFGDTCAHTLTTTIYVVDPALYTIVASTDTDTLIEGESTTIHAITDSTLDVYWSPAISLNNSTSFNPIATPEITTTYTVSILDSVGCPKTGSVTIYVMSKECDPADVFVPNTFTPNGDGNNDVLYVRGKELRTLYFAVYNRRGELIFETTDITKGWDGVYKEKKSDPDIFAWYLSGECFNGDKMKSKGNVTLIR
ncbi:MAG: PKD-like domain-containing protein [Bacteroidota bacterium]